jgi:hypothetical protein
VLLLKQLSKNAKFASFSGPARTWVEKALMASLRASVALQITGS